MIHCKDSSLLLDDMAENSVHAVVTDPPYGMQFLGLNWDKVLPDTKIWEACFKVMRPGAFLLAFGHTRIYHRLGCDLEDAGFEIKDCLCWAYASGFPHSLDISKAVDSKLGAERKVVGRRIHPTLRNKPTVKSNAYHADTLASDEEMESWDITEPATTEAKAWQGWGTQLKTAWEPIVMAQKPLEGTYAENVLKYNIGGLNIDECRIPYRDETDKKRLASFEHFAGKNYGDDKYFSANTGNKKQCNVHPLGRWPANLVWLDPLFVEYDHIFMIPKPSRGEKGDYNIHDTVKPVELMERLIQLVTPRPSIIKDKVVVLDPFMGSGTTGIAAKNLGRSFEGYEIDKESFKVAARRLKEKTKTYPDMFAV